MARFWPMVVSLLLLFSLSLVQAPRPCQGDGHGGACNMRSCACREACTCRAAHDLERRLAIAANAMCHGDAEQLEQACHLPGQSRHFAPADRDWDGLVLQPAAASPRWARGPAATCQLVHRVPARAVGPPEKPPRAFV